MQDTVLISRATVRIEQAVFKDNKEGIPYILNFMVLLLFLFI